ncbi:MAG: NUDIX domain-containing protein [Candidatus Omnitrophota bacterium]
MVKTKSQFSAGGVVCRKTGGLSEIILLIRGNGKIFCLPKGKIERLEASREAALREVKEEAGVNGAIKEDLGNIDYWFYSEEESARVHKTVFFFLIMYESGDIKDHDSDAEEVVWLPLKEALRVMTYPSEREIVGKAEKLLPR